ncbi:lytic transglycosylase domain-containing protein [Grimontia marina]|uniref:Membrane-bound lytic murein transglycosylase D n=1 Tax=Grimontia marina TaxID=646534 RepID=A0A128FC71_9GAMM|nr:Membrane-bound lytic murein transglycosylase D precursor [Grimontia marina]
MLSKHYRKTRQTLLLSCVLFFAVSVFAKPSQQAISKELAVLSPYEKQIQQRFNANTSLVSDILNRLKAYHLPQSFVLVPMLESSFNPNAVSPASATGLWQLMPATAERFGLSVSPNHDQRFDVSASTDAALAYLSFLHKKFKGDLSLTLAAYNAGEGRVSRAIKHAGNSRFTALTLPSETHQYVSRFYALSKLVDVNDLTPSPRFFLFANGAEVSTSPLIEFETLPPLIKL